MRPHSHRQIKTQSHTDTCRLMQNNLMSLLLIMLTAVSLHILIQKATATSELTVATLEKDTVCNKVRYVADFAQSSVNLHYDSLRSIHTVRQGLRQWQEMLPLQLDSTVSNGLVHTGAAATTVLQLNGF